jgi:hypothetical protein
MAYTYSVHRGHAQDRRHFLRYVDPHNNPHSWKHTTYNRLSPGKYQSSIIAVVSEEASNADALERYNALYTAHDALYTAHNELWAVKHE